MASSRRYTALLQLSRNHISSMAVCGMVHLRTYTLLLWKGLSLAERQTSAFQVFSVKILIPQLSTVWSAVVPIFKCNTSNKHVYPMADLPSFIQAFGPSLGTLYCESCSGSQRVICRTGKAHGLSRLRWVGKHSHREDS